MSDAAKASVSMHSNAATALSDVSTSSSQWSPDTVGTTDNNELLEKQIQSIPPQATSVHVIILVHGWMGSPLEQGYLQHALSQQSAQITSPEHNQAFVIHSATCNDGKTWDGIAAGGSRLATEVNGIFERLGTDKTITCSFVGNSLGGLYARYALSEMPLLSSGRVQPKVFCTTATPHLGTSRHTYLPLFRGAEYALGVGMQGTGRDLFRITDTIQRMTTESIFTKPLQSFAHRIAFANTHYSDFQVPTSTAAFLTSSSSHGDSKNHRLVQSNNNPAAEARSNCGTHDFEVLRVETIRRSSSGAESSTSEQQPSDKHMTCSEMAQILDDMGWTKVFCDVRSKLFSVPLFVFGRGVTKDDEGPPTKTMFSSAELLHRFGTLQGRRWPIPFGHTIMVANSKTPVYAKMNAAGQPLMDQLASEMIQNILQPSDDEN